MCLHKREADKKAAKIHDRINKGRAAERRGVVTGAGREIAHALQDAGLIRRSKPRAEV